MLNHNNIIHYVKVPSLRLCLVGTYGVNSSQALPHSCHRICQLGYPLQQRHAYEPRYAPFQSAPKASSLKIVNPNHVLISFLRIHSRYQ